MSTWHRSIIAVIIFAAVAVGATMISMYRFDDAKQTRIEEAKSDEIKVDSVYDDRIKSGLDPYYDRSAYRELAKKLEADTIHVDDYLAFDVDDAGLEAVRSEVTDLDSPIYVAFVNHTMLDDTDANLNLKAARIAHELSVDEATVLVVSPIGQGVGSKGIERKLQDYPEMGSDDSLTETALIWERALKKTQPLEASEAEPLVAEDNSDDWRELTYSPSSAFGGAGLGLIVGAVIAVIGVAILGYLRREKEATAQAMSRRSVNHRNRRK